ncbi:hypothetical protein [Flavobacterium frigidarium]|uniref:Ribosomal protein L30 ferredoxin-like fold domain-containing protein n=1 Tax=Flavobacterium frigidarium TaxID=99286 RepID=A0ABV4KFH0_9FLAO
MDYTQSKHKKSNLRILVIRLLIRKASKLLRFLANKLKIRVIRVPIRKASELLGFKVNRVKILDDPRANSQSFRVKKIRFLEEEADLKLQN